MRYVWWQQMPVLSDSFVPSFKISKHSFTNHFGIRKTFTLASGFQIFLASQRVSFTQLSSFSVTQEERQSSAHYLLAPCRTSLPSPWRPPTEEVSSRRGVCSVPRSPWSTGHCQGCEAKQCSYMLTPLPWSDLVKLSPGLSKETLKRWQRERLSLCSWPEWVGNIEEVWLKNKSEEYVSKNIVHKINSNNLYIFIKINE